MKKSAKIEIEDVESFLNSTTKTSTNKTEINDYVEQNMMEIISRIEKFTFGSGLTEAKITEHNLNVVRYRPLTGSSYVELPRELKNPMKGLINIKNDDDECFRWCHLAYEFPVKSHQERISSYKKHMDKLNYGGIDFPVKINDIPKIREDE